MFCGMLASPQVPASVNVSGYVNWILSADIGNYDRCD